MPKKLLIETRMNSLSLCEGVQSKTKGCLGTLEGPCADYKNPTRNSNFYSRRLWENVFNDPLVKESLEDRVLIGELDHPGDRLETKATNACIVMTGYRFDDVNSVVIGTFDILDTPNGNILRSLLDYGCKIGVSSRGEGDTTTVGDINNIDEETYYFVAFDAVVLPAVKKAKPTLQESLKRENLRNSLIEQVNSSTTVYELNLIKKVVESTELPDVDSILESIGNKSKELEGINSSSNLLEDLEKASDRVRQLTDENHRLNEEVINCNSELKKLRESRSKLIKTSNARISEYDELRKKYNRAMFQSGSDTRRFESLEVEADKLRSEISRLTENLKASKKDSFSKQEDLDRLTESLERLQKSYSIKSEETSVLRKELESSRKRISELEESCNRSKKEASDLRESVRKTKTDTSRAINESVKKYAIEMSRVQGIDSKRVLERLQKNSTIDDVSKIIREEVDRSDRYRKLPFVGDSLIESGRRGSAQFSSREESSEDNQTVSFMNEFYNKR